MRSGSAAGSSAVVSTANPQLGSRANNGPTRTMLPAGASPAVNAGNNAAAASLTTDQTGTNARITGSTVDIGAVEQPGLQFTSASSTTSTAQSSNSFNVVAVGTPTPTVSVTSGTLPTGVTLSSAGLLSGTPAAGTGGTYAVTITANNGTSTAQQSFTLTVNDKPTITSANSTTFTVGTAGNFQVRVGVYSINVAANSAAASIISTGSDAGTYLTASGVADQAITHVSTTGTGALENLVLLTESLSPGVVYMAPLTGVVQTGGFSLSILHGGITIDGI